MNYKHDKSGIYAIRNFINDKIYIGESKAIYCRWYNHRNELKRNKHKNTHLQNAWNLYGETMFRFEILEVMEGASKEELRRREHEYCLQYNSYNMDFGYNILIDNDCHHIKRRLIDYTKRKNSIKKVCQIDKMTGQLVKIWEGGIPEIASFYKKSAKKMRSLCFYRGKSFGGYVWVNEELYNPNFDYIVKIKPRVKKEKPVKTPKPMSERNIKRIPISLRNIKTGEIFSFKSRQDAAKELGINHNCLNNLIRGYKNKGNGKITTIKQWKGYELAT